MKISFHSIHDDEKIFFEADATFENNILKYVDKTNGESSVKFEIKENCITMDRSGSITMNMTFIPNEITEAYYSCGMVEFNFKVLCTNLFISNKKFIIDYQMIIDEEYTNEHKLWILFH